MPKFLVLQQEAVLQCLFSVRKHGVVFLQYTHCMSCAYSEILLLVRYAWPTLNIKVKEWVRIKL